MMLFSKQNSRTSRVSCVPKPSHIRHTEFPFDHLKPVGDLVIDVPIVLVPVHHLDSPRFEVWMASFECLSPFFLILGA
jgi:hypothetical protein